MSPPWSRPLILALSADGAALRRADGSIVTLVEAERVPLNAQAKALTSSLAQDDLQQTMPPASRGNDHLLQALAQVAPQLAKQKIRIVLSNHYVRYGVLPAQPEVSKRSDWLDMARLDFRQRYGAVSEQWEIKVHLGRYAHNVLSFAMDKSLLAGLLALGQAHAWHIDSIQPLLNAVLAKPLAAKLPVLNSDSENKPFPLWLLMAEPGRVVLAELMQRQYQRFSVISPLAGQEIDAARQMIARNLLQLDAKQQPRQILVAASTQIASMQPLTGWLDEGGLVKMIHTEHAAATRPHAAWMAGL